MSQTIAEQKIDIAYPDAAEPTLVLRTGPCRIHFGLSDGPSWIAGLYSDPSGVLPLQIQTGPVTTIAQSFAPTAFSRTVLPQLDLAFGRERPFALQIEAGASETFYDLGGVPLTSLAVRAGAGTFDLDFAAPNPTTMRAMEISGGAGAFTAKRLANAGFLSLKVGGGVAALSLDFGGALVHDATARIDMGLGSVDLFVPALTPARVHAKTFASGVHVSGGFSKQGEDFATTPGIQGAHPLLEIDASISFGALNLATI